MAVDLWNRSFCLLASPLLNLSIADVCFRWSILCDDPRHGKGHQMPFCGKRDTLFLRTGFVLSIRRPVQYDLWKTDQLPISSKCQGFARVRNFTSLFCKGWVQTSGKQGLRQFELLEPIHKKRGNRPPPSAGGRAADFQICAGGGGSRIKNFWVNLRQHRRNSLPWMPK